MDIKIILSIVGALISLAAVVLIYNARKIVRERFSFGDQNSGTLAVKTDVYKRQVYKLSSFNFSRT